MFNLKYKKIVITTIIFLLSLIPVFFVPEGYGLYIVIPAFILSGSYLLVSSEVFMKNKNNYLLAFGIHLIFLIVLVSPFMFPKLSQVGKITEFILYDNSGLGSLISVLITLLFSITGLMLLIKSLFTKQILLSIGLLVMIVVAISINFFLLFPIMGAGV